MCTATPTLLVEMCTPPGTSPSCTARHTDALPDVCVTLCVGPRLDVT